MTVEYVGRKIGNYYLGDLIGRGGFASVYLGEHLYLGKQAAVKIMPTSLTKENKALFVQEAQMLARLDHPGIIRVLEFGIDEQGEATYLVMQYAPNGTVRQRYPRGTCPPLAVVRSYIERVASALQYAHERKIVHRDVKPENLLLGNEEQPLLSDFGIAVVASSARIASDAENIAGTISYMAPEQLRGNPCAASDQYALGIVAYEWLCGCTPFSGSSTELMAKHMFATPPTMSKFIPGIPDELERVVMRALAKQPEQRFPSVRAFAAAFLRASEDLTEQDLTRGAHSESTDNIPADYGTVFGNSFTARLPPVKPQSSVQTSLQAEQQVAIASMSTKVQGGRKTRLTRRVVVASGLGAAALTAIGGVGGLWFSRKSRESPTTTQPLKDDVYVYRRAQLDVNYVAWLPGNKRVLTLLDGSDLYAWDAETGAHEQWIFPGTTYQGQMLLKGILPVALSPDGKQLAVSTSDGLLIGQLGANQYELLTKPAFLNALWWSPGGTSLLLATNDGFELWDLRTRRKVYERSSSISSSANDVGRILCWAPDGKSIASVSDDYQSVTLWSAEAGHYGQRITTFERAGISVQTLAWSPDSKQLAISWQNESVQVWDIVSHKLMFTCARAVLGPEVLAWSSDGNYLLGASDTAEKDTSLYIWRMRKNQENAVGTVAKVYGGHQQTILTAAWSPDSKYIITGSGRIDGLESMVKDATARVWRAPG